MLAGYLIRAQRGSRARRAQGSIAPCSNSISSTENADTLAEHPRILVVDDNDDNRYTLTLYLDLEGYKDVTTAQDGEEAIAPPEDDRFDVVLLDLQMPKVDGHEVLAWLNEQAQLRDLPVIMISALSEMNGVARCIELGAVDYLLKPFNPVLLRARLAATLEKKRLRDQVNAHLARLEAEVEAARRLQMGMVPQSFPPPTPRFSGRLSRQHGAGARGGRRSVRFLPPEDGRLGFLVGDVSGKGMPAALFMARTKSLIRIASELMHGDGGAASPADIITRVNRELCQDNNNMMFVTMFFAVLAPATGARLLQCGAQSAVPAGRRRSRRSRTRPESSSGSSRRRPMWTVR